MCKPRKAALLWSGGKDVSMHGVRRDLIEDQADAVGLPVRFVVIPSPEHPSCPMAHAPPGTSFPPNDMYSAAMLDALGRLKAAGIAAVVFGDIFLEDLRAYRDRLLAHAGLEGRYPLWGWDSGALYDRFVAFGFEAITVCVDTARLSEGHLGRPLDAAFRDALPAGADPCGERGEYHAFASAGPPFRRPVRFALGEVHRHAPFAFRELYPVATEAPSQRRS